MAKITCSIEGCEGPVASRGWCGMHYRRWRKHGDPEIERGVRSDKIEGSCSVLDCDDPVRSLGLCSAHYQRERNGVPATVTRRKVVYGTAGERFWAKVIKESGITGSKPELGQCWIWTGSVNRGGYGQFGISRGNSRLAHRYGYEVQVGPIPQGLDLDHLCRVRHCVRGSHLEAVTERENVLRSPVAPPAVNAAKTHCIRHHALEGGNLYVDPQGKRQCRTCMRIRKARPVRA